MAWHYKAYGKDQSRFDFTGYALVELQARYRRRGLWADPRPVAPWKYRQATREASSGWVRPEKAPSPSKEQTDCQFSSCAAPQTTRSSRPRRI